MQAYAVVIIQAPDYIHYQAFWEMGLLLTRAIRSLNKTCDLVINRLFEDRVNIILNYNLLSPSDIDQLAHYNCVIYQLEQLSDREGFFDQRLRKALQSVRSVWDYSRENLDFLAGHGIKGAKHLPIGYHKDLEMIERSASPDLDILFYGSLNPRREAIINQLRQTTRTESLFGVYGAARDKYIARSKIILNLHYYETQLLEQVRLSYLLNNKCFVVSEESKNNPYNGAIVTTNYANIVDTCDYYLRHEEEREKIRRAGYDKFRKNKMEDNLKLVLKAD